MGLIGLKLVTRNTPYTDVGRAILNKIFFLEFLVLGCMFGYVKMH